jgi:hypothetical protein
MQTPVSGNDREPAVATSVNSTHVKGPLFVDPDNRRYFTDGTKVNGHYKAVYLSGSHTWCNFLDCGSTTTPPAFDYSQYLDFLVAHHHNFIRLWREENARGGEQSANFWFSPMPYQRSSKCCAYDGGKKFDLNKFNQAYFDRLRDHVIQAGNRGIYVSIMLFDGWSVESQIPTHQPWPGHPYNTNNNINRVNGDLNNDGQGGETHTLQSSKILALQESYVRKVIDTVNDLDNVLYEISNEDKAGGNSTSWQYHMVTYIKNYEATKAKQHPVGLSVERNCLHNDQLFTSPADWVSPCFDVNNPVVGTGNKVVLDDTDHGCGICGNEAWAWKSFTHGLNPLFMDPYDGAAVEKGAPVGYDPNNPNDVSLRDNLGYTVLYSQRIDLAAMPPHPELCSTSYCLANPVPNGAEYLVYLPAGENISKLLYSLGVHRNPLVYLPSDSIVTVDLSAAAGELTVEWFNPTTGDTVLGKSVIGGKSQSFTAPFAGDAVLYIHDDSLSPTPSATETPSLPASTPVSTVTSVVPTPTNVPSSPSLPCFGSILLMVVLVIMSIPIRVLLTH